MKSTELRIVHRIYFPDYLFMPFISFPNTTLIAQFLSQEFPRLVLIIKQKQFSFELYYLTLLETILLLPCIRFRY